MTPFEIVEHTADVGIAVRAPDLPSLFLDAARGMFSVIYDGHTEGWPVSHSVTLDAPDTESLLVDWLSELLYLFDIKHFFFHSARFDTFEPGRLVASCSGAQLKSLPPGTEIKAVTHHLLSVDRTAHGFETTIYFDL